VSVTLTFTFDPPLVLGEWLLFCRSVGISYNQRTMGRNAFYTLDGAVELLFGDASYDDLPWMRHGSLDLRGPQPPAQAATLRVWAIETAGLPGVVAVGQVIARRWPRAWVVCDPELRRWFPQARAD
jgi:hypothetical protein